MSGKIIDWDFHTLALFEFAQGVRQQIKLEGVWMVKVIIIAGCQQLLLRGQDLRTGTLLQCSITSTVEKYVCVFMMQKTKHKPLNINNNYMQLICRN